MGLETAAADHACNVVRRQIQEEFPELTLLYMVHHDNQRAKALDLKTDEIRQHPAGEALLPLLKKMTEKDGFEFSGISTGTEKKILPFLSKKKTLTCFFVNADRLETSDDAKRHALFLAFHALSLIEDVKNQNTNDYQEANGVVTPKVDKILRAWKNMLADTFSVLMLELEKKRDSIGTLGRMRSLAALDPVRGGKPEHYPFPLVLDATRLLYHDMAKIQSSATPLQRAMEMTREIGETFDRSSVKQWWAFTRTAQEMAWLGADHNAILGAAVYNSEDPNARATAYLVAEALNIQTLTPAPMGSYNPFAEDETSERHHLKACEERFRTVMSKANIKNSPEPFLEEVAKENKKLLEGNPIGWCAYPLLCAEVFFRSSADQARAAFDKALQEANWNKVHDVMRMILLLKREGHTITPEFVAEKLQEIDDLKFLAPCFMRIQ